MLGQNIIITGLAFPAQNWYVYISDHTPPAQTMVYHHGKNGVVIETYMLDLMYYLTNHSIHIAD